MKWKILHDNVTKWWDVYSETHRFQSNSERHALWLCDLLNKIDELDILRCVVKRIPKNNPYDNLVNFINRHNIPPKEEQKLREVIAEIKFNESKSDTSEPLIAELIRLYK